MTHNDGVARHLFHALAQDVGLGQFGFAASPAFLFQPHTERFAATHERGQQPHAQRGAGDEHLLRAGAPQMRRAGLLQQHERELARTAQADARHQRLPVHESEPARDQGDEPGLDQHQADCQGQDRLPVIECHAHINHEPNGHEKEREEEILDRHHIRENARLEDRLAHRQSGNEGPESQPEIQHAADEGQADAAADDAEGEQLTVACPGHRIQQHRNQPAR